MAASISAPVGFVGLGVMGRAVASRLVAAGADVYGYDVASTALDAFAADGGLVAASPAAVASVASEIVVMVHDEAQVNAVLFGSQGAAARLGAGATVWLASTVSPGFARSVGARLAERGTALVDGPVSGGVPRARAGDLSVFAGADDSAMQALEPVLRACASSVFRVGGVGAGSAMKLINQILTAANIALTAEALVLARRSGVDAELLIAAVTHSAGASRQFELRAPLMAAGDHTVHATVRTFLKDLRIALAAAGEVGLEAPMAAAAASVFARAGELGHLDQSDTTLVDAYAHDFQPTLADGRTEAE